MNTIVKSEIETASPKYLDEIITYAQKCKYAIEEDNQEKTRLQSKWPADKDRLNKLVNEVSKELGNNKEKVVMDVRVTMEVEPKWEEDNFRECLVDGDYEDSDFTEHSTKVTISYLDGKRKDAKLRLIQEHVNDYLEDACDEKLVLFPNYRKKLESLLNRASKLDDEIVEYIENGFHLTDED